MALKRILVIFVMLLAGEASAGNIIVYFTRINYSSFAQYARVFNCMKLPPESLMLPQHPPW